jgi:hypothetical protein
MMPNWKLLIAAISLVGLVAGDALSGEFDGSRPLFGVTGKIVEIRGNRIDGDVDPDTLGIPQKFRIDFAAGLLRPSKDSVIRKTIAIEKVTHVEDMLVLQGVDGGVDGVDDGLAWNLVVSKKDGKAVLSAAGAGVAYVVFGQCSPAAE